MQSKKAAPVPSAQQVALQRRQHTDEPDEMIEIRNDQLLAMSDVELRNVLSGLGMTITPQHTRDMMLSTIVRLAQSARDD